MVVFCCNQPQPSMGPWLLWLHVGVCWVQTQLTVNTCRCFLSRLSCLTRKKKPLHIKVSTGYYYKLSKIMTQNSLLVCLKKPQHPPPQQKSKLNNWLKKKQQHTHKTPHTQVNSFSCQQSLSLIHI